MHSIGTVSFTSYRNRMSSGNDYYRVIVSPRIWRVLDLDMDLRISVAAYYAVDSILVVATHKVSGSEARVSCNVVVADEHVATTMIC